MLDLAEGLGEDGNGFCFDGCTLIRISFLAAEDVLFKVSGWGGVSSGGELFL